MEASALQAPAGLARSKLSLGSPLLRLRSDEQLVSQFRAGDDEAFRIIHDRYRQRLFAYARQMLPCRQDAEDALQDVFVRAYAGLRANNRALALRSWLYRIAHNRCIDELRRPALPVPEVMELTRAPILDPLVQAEERESLRRLIADLRRLPDQQRSALLMRELSGISYAELAGILGVSVPAVKSLLVRARVSLAQSMQARDTACSDIRDELILAHDRRVRPNAMARKHLRDCAPCREFRREIRGLSKQLAALAPTLGPAGVLANLLGLGGSGSAAAGGGAFAGSGALASGAAHVATLLAAAAVTAGGAVEIQHSLADGSAPPTPHATMHFISVPAVSTAPTAVRVPRATAASGSAAAATVSSQASSPSVTGSHFAGSVTGGGSRGGGGGSAASDPGSVPAQGAALTVGMGPGPLDGTDPNAGTPGDDSAGGSADGSSSSTSSGSTGTTTPAGSTNGSGASGSTAPVTGTMDSPGSSKAGSTQSGQGNGYAGASAGGASGQ